MVHRSGRRVLAELRLDLIASSTVHRPKCTASPHAQKATFDSRRVLMEPGFVH